MYIYFNIKMMIKIIKILIYINVCNRKLQRNYYFSSKFKFKDTLKYLNTEENLNVWGDFKILIHKFYGF